MALLEKNDVLFAHKALNLIPELNGNTRRVAGAIIDHFNKRDGRCYPGVERLAKMLVLDRATVLRATRTLQDMGLIEKKSHGGRHHTASYHPQWQRFRAIVEDWDARMKDDVGSEEPISAPASAENKVAILPRSESQDCDVDSRNPATQTLRNNPSNKPIETEQVETPTGHPPNPPGRKRIEKAPKRDLRREQRNFLFPLNGGKQMSRGEAARDAAQRRWELDAKTKGEHVYAAVVEWITPERQQTATDAEMKRRGGGFEFIAASMHNERRFARG